MMVCEAAAMKFMNPWNPAFEACIQNSWTSIASIAHFC